MATKTRKKNPAGLRAGPVRLSQADRERLLTDLLDFQGTAGEAQAIVDSTQLLLTNIRTELLRARQEPLAPNLIAELEPIHQAARRLRGLLRTAQLSAAARKRLRLHGAPKIEAVERRLEDLEFACGLALAPLRGRVRSHQAAGGAVRSQVRRRREQWEQALRAFFRRLAHEPTDQELENFLALCRKYMAESGMAESGRAESG